MTDEALLTAPEVLEVLYREHGSLMVTMARAQWSLPEPEAEAVVHDVFLSFLERQPQVENVRAFLLGATRNACRHYWRKRGRESPLPEELADANENARQARWAMLTTLILAMDKMGERCRDALHSFYVGDERLEVIAERLNTTPGYVRQILHGCRKRLRDLVADGSRRAS